MRETYKREGDEHGARCERVRQRDRAEKEIEEDEERQ